MSETRDVIKRHKFLGQRNRCLKELDELLKYKRRWETLKAHYAGSCLKDTSYDEIYGLMETMEHE